MSDKRNRVATIILFLPLASFQLCCPTRQASDEREPSGQRHEEVGKRQ